MLRWLLPVVALLALAAPLRAEIAHVDAAALQKLIQDGVRVVDVRTAAEWDKTGVVEGSHLLTFFDENGGYDVRGWMERFAAIAAPEQPVAILCHSGGRSKAVSRLLDRHFKYRRVYNVEGGIARWIGEGRPTVKRD